MQPKKTILVTGGAGYIGSHTIIELLQITDFNVVSIDNFSNSPAETFARIEKITGKKVINYNIDLCDQAAVMNILEAEKEIAGIIHFAAYKSVDESVANPYKYYYNNINSLLSILEACIKQEITNFIFSSSCSVYGNIGQLPVTEVTPLGKVESPYAFTKQIGEKIITDYAHSNTKMQTISLRYFNPVGAHSSGLIGESSINKPSNLVPIITQTAIGKIQQMTVHGNDYTTRDRTCIRDYIHVTDIATAHLKALLFLLANKNKSPVSVFNLGSGKGVTVLEAIQAFEKISGKKLSFRFGKRRPGDVEAVYSDCNKALNELEWKPVHDIYSMMESAWKWQLNLEKEENGKS